MASYLKAIVALIGVVMNALNVYYGHATWYPIVMAGVTAVLVYLVPNTPKTPAVFTMDVNSAYPKDLPSPMTEAQQEIRDGWDKIQ